jgi:hypothetical protein
MSEDGIKKAVSEHAVWMQQDLFTDVIMPFSQQIRTHSKLFISYFMSL